MKKNGFTLIELLAVIVILAIIALIATPIILGIINDARKESNERSAELYASAVRNAIASYQLTHPNAPASFSDLDVQFDGEVECAKEELYADGSFYIADCTVNGDVVDYTYGEQPLKQPTRYYTWDLSGTLGETVVPTNPSSVPPTGKNLYLGYEVDANNKVSTAYVCFKKEENGTEYCLKGYDTDAYATNVDIIKDAYADVVDTNACSFFDFSSSCHAGGLFADASSIDNVSASNGSAECAVDGDGDFECYVY